MHRVSIVLSISLYSGISSPEAPQVHQDCTTTVDVIRGSMHTSFRWRWVIHFPVNLQTLTPGSSRPSSTFYDELTNVLESLIFNSCPVRIGGDINIHVEWRTQRILMQFVWRKYSRRSTCFNMLLVPLTNLISRSHDLHSQYSVVVTQLHTNCSSFYLPRRDGSQSRAWHATHCSSKLIANMSSRSVLFFGQTAC